MKFNQSTFNPLQLISDYIATISGSYLTVDHLEVIKAHLQLGGVACDTNDEVVTCIAILEELGVLKIVEHKDKNTTYYEVFKTYGK